MEIAARDKYNLCFACGQENPLVLKLEDGTLGAEANAFMYITDQEFE
ncbi:MAG: hypothetical protein ABH969_03170 [Pseudomonadota bacterium]|nr:hypothetical protein [Pseudomonadota bacterium]